MKYMIDINEIEKIIVEVRGKKVLVDRDVAFIYGLETKRINEAVKNNLEKFPSSYMLELTDIEKFELVENFDRFEKLKYSSVETKAFTERGLYMLATILKGKKARDVTFTIIETFAKLKELSNTIAKLSKADKKEESNNLMKKGGELFTEILGDSLNVEGTETTIEINFAVLKFKHTLKSAKR